MSGTLAASAGTDRAKCGSRLLVDMLTVASDDGTLYVAEDEGQRGQDGPFYVVYRTEDRERRYGYYCSNCESVDVAMDSMRRIKCNGCGNFTKPDEWDSAHE